MSETQQDGIYRPTGFAAWAICDPHRRAHRMLALAFISFLGFGSYFCYDNPAALEEQIENDMEVTTTQFSSLYALYSWPNVFMCFVGGLLIDGMLGVRLGAIVFLILLVFGQTIFAFGAMTGQFWVMQLGRFVFGLGGESLQVAQNTYTAAWFRGQELNMVFGLQISVARAGSFLNMNVVKPVYDHISGTNSSTSAQTVLGYTLLLAGITCLFSMFCGFVIALLDRRAARILQRGDIKSGEKIHLSDVKNFKTEFWLITSICVTFYVTIFPFIALGSRFFQSKWNFSDTRANAADSVIYVISTISSPFIGLLVDVLGRNLMFLLFGCSLVLICHMSLAVTFINLWVPLIGIGIGYSILCSALWPLVAFVVPQHQLATAYGCMQAFQNLGLAILSNVAGMVVDWKGYIMLELFFVLWLSVAVISCIVLIVVDRANGGSLNRSAHDRRVLTASEPTPCLVNQEDDNDELNCEDSGHNSTDTQ